MMSVPVWLSLGALWVLVVFQGLVLLGLVRAVHTLRGGHARHESLQDLEDMVHKKAPDFQAFDLAGVYFDSAKVAEQPRAFLFVSPRCESCSVTANELASLRWKSEGDVYVVCRGGVAECREFSEQVGAGTRVLVDDSFEISRAFKVTAVPTAVLIDASNTVRSYGNPMRDNELIEISDKDLESAVGVE